MQKDEFRGRRGRWLVAPAMALVLAGCGGGAEDSSQASARPLTVARAVATPLAQPADTSGRLLASNCFQCHGTGGVGGFDSIRGKEASEVLEFLQKPASSTIMAAHAQGYTRAQLDAIVAYLQQL